MSKDSEEPKREKLKQFMENRDIKPKTVLYPSLATSNKDINAQIDALLYN
jgi:hypothetical protein